MKLFQLVRVLMIVSLVAPMVPSTARADDYPVTTGIRGFFHRFVRNGTATPAATPAPVTNSDDDNSDDTSDASTQASVTEPAPVVRVAISPSVVTVAPVASASATTSLQSGVDQSHPQVLSIQFNPSTSDSTVAISGTVTSGTGALQLIWTSPAVGGTPRTDIQMVPIRDGKFQTQITLQYGPGAYPLKTSVGLQTPRGLAYYSDSNQNQGSIENQDPIPAFSRLASSMVQSDAPQIQALARSLIQNISNVYDQAHAIHDWVSKNVSYDYSQITHNDGTKDYYTVVPTDNDNSSTVVLAQRKGICFGYANLTAALLRSIGIPAKSVSGPVLLTANDHWDESLPDNQKPNLHAWAEAFVDGRWISIDTTWDHVYGQKYFDPSPAVFAQDHRKINDL